MLILDGASENKLTELVKVSEELNETLREYYPGVHKIIPDRAALIWCAIDGEIAKRQDQIDKILNTKKGAEGVTTDYATYIYLRDAKGLPCGDQKYYRARRKFYWLMSKKI